MGFVLHSDEPTVLGEEALQQFSTALRAADLKIFLGEQARISQQLVHWYVAVVPASMMPKFRGSGAQAYGCSSTEGRS